MTRKDYEAIAVAIGQSCAEIERNMKADKVIDIIVEHISHALQINNPAFKPELFKKYIAIASVNARMGNIFKAR